MTQLKLNRLFSVSAGNVGTLFFRAYLDSTQVDTDFTIGVTSLTTTDNPNGDYVSPMRFNLDDGNTAGPPLNNALEVYDDPDGPGGVSAGYQSVNSPGTIAPIETETWHSFWMVADTNTGSWELYVQGGDVTTQTQIAYGSNDTSFAFRDTSTINSLLLRPNGDNNNDIMYIDDIYVDSDSGAGGNLSNPVIPEPSTLALVVIAGTGALIGYRRKD